MPAAPARPVPRVGQDLGLIADEAFAYGDEAVARLEAGRANYGGIWRAVGGHD